MVLFKSFVAILSLFIGWSSAGNTTCISTELDWYINQVGETPCRTYERLRQICNQNYEVGNFRPQTPGDNCDDQLPECCCNSIAFALSMLCMNCQQCRQGPACIDAGPTAYEMYRANGGGTCSDRTALVNQNFTADIQSAACNKDIRIPQSLYNLFWVDGAWFFAFTRDATAKEFAAQQDGAFHQCPAKSSSISPSQTPTQTPITSPSSSPSPSPSGGSEEGGSSSNIGAIVGGVIGGLGGLALILFAFVFWKRRDLQRKQGPLDLSAGGPVHPFTGPPMMQQPMGDHSAFNSSSLYSSPGPNSVVSSAPSAVLPYSKRPLPMQPTHLSQPSDPSSGPVPSAYATSSLGDDDRHVDGGAVLGRSASGRLPPSYGQWA